MKRFPLSFRPQPARPGTGPRRFWFELLLALLAGLVWTAARAQPIQSAPTLPAPGRYVVSVTTAGLGRMQLLFELRQQGDSLLTGTTAPELPRRLVGGLAAAFVAKTLFDNGSLAKLNLRRPGAGRPSRLALATQGVFNFVPAPVAGGGAGETAGGFGGELRHVRTGVLVGTLVAVPTTLAVLRPDYPALVGRLLELAEAKLYNPALLRQKPWRDYRTYMLDKAPSFADDGDLLFASMYKARSLPFSHFFLMGDKAAVPAAVAQQARQRPASVRSVAPGVVLLDIPQFDLRAAAIDSLLALVRQSQPRTLVIDLRQNTGGDLEGGMRLLQHLAPRPLFGGTLLSQRWWQAHAAPATAAEAAQLPRLSRASYADSRAQRGTVAGLTLQIEPLPTPQLTPLTVPVFVLISRRTASAAEPVAFGIQYYKLSKLVGETTAGAVLSMEELPLDRYTFQLPLLSYYAPDGRELDQVGVKPDHTVAPDQALDYVLTKLLPAAP